jgi:hypothetical protein
MSPFAAPSNVEISKHLFQQTRGSEISLKEFQSRNIGELKDFKINKLEKSKVLIEAVHQRLRSSRQLNNDLLNL